MAKATRPAKKKALKGPMSKAKKKSKTSKSRKKSVAVKNLPAKKGKAGKMGMAAVRRRIV